MERSTLVVSQASLCNINKAIEGRTPEEWPMEENIPEHYHELLPVLIQDLPNHLPLHRPGIDHEVRLKEGEVQS